MAQQWVITRDYTVNEDDDDRQTGIGADASGFKNDIPEGEHPLLGQANNIKFLLLDDDGEVYYAGETDEADFGPLNWARNYAGATTMLVRDPETGRWSQL